MANPEAVLSRLRDMGKITHEDIREADSTIINKEETAIVGLLHIMMCELDHDEGECQWYVEANMTDTWERVDHKTWLEAVMQLMLKLKIDWKGMKSLVDSMEGIYMAGTEAPRLVDKIALLNTALCELSVAVRAHLSKALPTSESNSS